MARATLWRDGEPLSTRLLSAPKRADIKSWSSKLQKLFNKELEGAKHDLVKSSVTVTHIRIALKNGDTIDVDRQGPSI